MRTGEIAKRLGIHRSTVRGWCTAYAKYLSAGIVDRAAGQNRELSERDALVLATVADGRRRGLSHEAVLAALEAGNLVDHLPDMPALEDMELQRQSGFVPVGELHRVLDQLHMLAGERDRLIAERDQAQCDVKENRSHIADLERQLGRALGEIQAINRSDFWLRYVAVAVLVLSAIVIAVLLFGGVLRGV